VIINSAKHLGMINVGPSAPGIPMTATDYTPYVNAILAAHPQMIVSLLHETGLLPPVSGLRPNDYKGPSEAFVTYNPTLIAANADGRDTLEREHILT